MKPQAILLSLVAAFTLCIGSGCASFPTLFEAGVSELTKTLDAKYQEWLAKQEAAGETIGNTTPEAPGTVAEPVEADAVPFSALAWTYGGFPGQNAYLGSPRISNLSVTSNGLSFKYDVDLSGWGYAHTDAGGALACLFCRVDGKWRGGKIDWISSSRNTRDFNNPKSGYGGWKASDLDNADAFAFVIVAKDQKRRSNVIMQEVKK